MNPWPAFLTKILVKLVYPCALRPQPCAQGHGRPGRNAGLAPLTAAGGGIAFSAARGTLDGFTIEITRGIAAGAKGFVTENKANGHTQQAEPDNHHRESNIEK